MKNQQKSKALLNGTDVVNVKQWTKMWSACVAKKSKPWNTLNYQIRKANILQGVYVTIGNPAFCLFLYLTGVHFRGELQHDGDVSQQKIKCRPIRAREIGGVSLSTYYMLKQARIS